MSVKKYVAVQKQVPIPSPEDRVCCFKFAINEQITNC